MKYVRIRAESQDRDAPPIEVFAFVDGADRVLADLPAFGNWGWPNGDYCYFEFANNTMDFGSNFDDRLYDFELAKTPIMEGRILSCSARGYNSPKTYKIVKISQVVADGVLGLR